MKHFNEYYRACAQILSELKAENTAFLPSGKPAPARVLACGDDDLISAIKTAEHAYLIREMYGYLPYIICFGGVGPLSKYMHKREEALHQADVLLDLGISPEHIKICKNGRNSGENIKEVEAMAKSIAKNETICWILPARLSLRMALSIEKQAPSLNSIHLPIEQSVADIIRSWYNGKGFCSGLALFSEVASILSRIEDYATRPEPFCEPIPFVVSKETRKAAEVLSVFTLKVAANGTRAGKLIARQWQFLKLLYAIKTSKEKRERNLKHAVDQMAVCLWKKGLIKEDDLLYDRFVKK